jgi:hypothetical protein
MKHYQCLACGTWWDLSDENPACPDRYLYDHSDAAKIKMALIRFEQGRLALEDAWAKVRQRTVESA